MSRGTIWTWVRRGTLPSGVEYVGGPYRAKFVVDAARLAAWKRGEP